MSVDLDALDRLAAAATPGPWRSQGWVPTWAYVPLMDARHNVVATMYHDASHDYTRNEVAANAAFIAASREAVPDLIAALRASQAENARLREALERIATWSKYRAASTGFDEDPSSANDPLVEAYERGANDMVDTLAPIASAALTQGQVT